MDGIGADAARKLTESSTRLSQLEREVADGAVKLAELSSGLKSEQLLLSQLRRAKEQHQRHHSSLLTAWSDLNDRNLALQAELKTKQEIRENLKARLAEMVEAHEAVALDMSRSAMNIQMLSAKLDASEIVNADAVDELKKLQRQKAGTEKLLHKRTHELSRVRAHSAKAHVDSEYVERTLS